MVTSRPNELDGALLASLHFETKSIKSKAIFLRTSFLKRQMIRLVQGHCTGVKRQLIQTAIFIATPLKKHLAVHFTKGYFIVNLLTEKLSV